MIKVFKLSLIFSLYSICIFGQENGLKSEILGYDDSKSVLISKGRKLLLDKFLEGDIYKVNEVKNYLKAQEDDDYFAFYPAEFWYLSYWTGDYKVLAKDLQKSDSAQFASYATRISPLQDKLFDKVFEKTVLDEQLIKVQIDDSELDSETKEFLKLSLSWLLLETKENIYEQDSINMQADLFLEKYPSSEYEEFMKKNIRFRYVASNWGYAMDLSTGFGLFTGNLSKNYTNNVPMAIGLDVYYKNYELYLREYVGMNKSKTSKEYSLGTFEKDEQVRIFSPELSLGYAVYNNNRYKISPYVGIAWMNVTPTPADIEEIPELKELALDYSTTYLLGFNLDIKFGAKKVPEFRPKTNYSFIKIRYTYGMPQFENKYAGMTGNMHSITIGYGGATRGVKRK